MQETEKGKATDARYAIQRRKRPFVLDDLSSGWCAQCNEKPDAGSVEGPRRAERTSSRWPSGMKTSSLQNLPHRSSKCLVHFLRATMIPFR